MITMNMDTTYIDIIIQWMKEQEMTDQHHSSQIKPSLTNVYHIFIGLYSLVGLLGAIGSIIMMAAILKKRLFKDPTFVLMFNLAFNGFITSVGVLPLTLTVLLMKFWVFGSFICSIYPMLQAFPVYASLVTFLMIVCHKYIGNNYEKKLKGKLARCCLPFAILLTIWIITLCAIMPYAFHVKYIDLGTALGKDFKDIGLCSVDSEQDFLRKIHISCLALVFLFCSVFAICLSGLLRTKLKKQKYKESMEMYDPNKNAYNFQPDIYMINNGHCQQGEEAVINIRMSELDKERRLLGHVTLMTIVFSICWFPLVLVIAAHQFDHKLEGPEGGPRADITHLTLLLVGFVSTCTTPLLFGAWMRSSPSQEGNDHPGDIQEEEVPEGAWAEDPEGQPQQDEAWAVDPRYRPS